MCWHHVFVVVTPVDVRGLVQLQHRGRGQLARSKLGGSVVPLALLRVSDEIRPDFLHQHDREIYLLASRNILAVPSYGYKFQGGFALSGCELTNQTEDVAQNAASGRGRGLRLRLSQAGRCFLFRIALNDSRWFVVGMTPSTGILSRVEAATRPHSDQLCHIGSGIQNEMR